MRLSAVVPGQIFPLVLALTVLLPQVALALTGSQVYERVKDSVVVVKAYDRAGKAVGLGSGVVLPSGDIFTNYHVFKTGVRHTVERGGKAVPATVKAGDPDKDLCLVSAPGLTATPARLGQASRLTVGEHVYAVGAPQGLELSLSEGIVSQLRGGPPPIIQTTVAISPGSSGGGLFNAEGELVGITTFYLKEGQGLNFALPVEWVKKVAPSSTHGQAAEEFNPDDWEPVVPEPGEKSTSDWSDRADPFFKANDWQGLLNHCQQWTRAEPDSGDAWFELGLAYEMLGHHQEAIDAFRKGLRIKPDNVRAWTNLGVSYEKLGLHRESIGAHRKALRLEPLDAQSWYNLGCAYGKLGRYREASEAYRETLRLKPDYAEAWYGLGVTYGQFGRYWEAIQAYQEALRLKPDDVKAWNNLALAYSLSGNNAAALEAVRELRRYDPQKADKVFNLIMKP